MRADAFGDLLMILVYFEDFIVLISGKDGLKARCINGQPVLTSSLSKIESPVLKPMPLMFYYTNPPACPSYLFS